MQITDVRIRRAKANETKLRAYCSVVFDGMFVVHEIRIIEGVKGLFVSMPRRKTNEGEFKDMAHPITAEARDIVHAAVLKAYAEFERKEASKEISA